MNFLKCSCGFVSRKCRNFWRFILVVWIIDWSSLIYHVIFRELCVLKFVGWFVLIAIGRFISKTIRFKTLNWVFVLCVGSSVVELLVSIYPDSKGLRYENTSRLGFESRPAHMRECLRYSRFAFAYKYRVVVRKGESLGQTA